MKLPSKNLNLGVGFLLKKYNTISYRAGDLRDNYDDREVQKSHEERQAAMERLEIIKNAKGPMLRSKLVAEVLLKGIYVQ